MFGAFILGCGATHAMESWTLWHGTYRLAGLVKLFTTIVSVATAVALVPLVPKALALPQPEELQAVHQDLEIRTRKLERSNAELRSSTTAEGSGWHQRLAEGPHSFLRCRFRKDMSMEIRAVEILLVEDNPGDVRLTKEAFKESKITNNLHVIEDGISALEYLRQEGNYAGAVRPDVILLDLNLPRKDGREVLAELKSDQRFSAIPVVVLTTSEADEDVFRAYHLHANCYITKPIDFEQFHKVVREIESFWFTLVKLPPRGT